MEGAARKRWRHGIGFQATQTDGRSPLFTRTNPRWSLTFRTVNMLKVLPARRPSIRSDKPQETKEETVRVLEEKRGLVRVKNLPTKVTFSSISKEPLIDGKPIVPCGGRVLSRRSKQILSRSSQEGGSQPYPNPY